MTPFRLFGNRLGVNENDALVELHEATICSTPSGIRELANHLLNVADEMDATDQEDFDGGWHYHFRPEGRPEIVICGWDAISASLPPITYDGASSSYRRQR